MSCQPTAKKVFTKEALAEQVEGLTGETTTIEDVLAAHKGKTILIDLWASWCPDCIKALPTVAKVQEKYPEVVYLFLSVDNKKEDWINGVEKRVKPKSIQAAHYWFPTGWTKDGSNKFIDFVGLDWIPRYMVIAKDGTIANFYSKSTEDQEILQALEN